MTALVTHRIHRWTEGDRLWTELVATLELGPVLVSVYSVLASPDPHPPYLVRGHRVAASPTPGTPIRLQLRVCEPGLGALTEADALALAQQVFDVLASLGPMPEPATPQGVSS